MEKVQCDCCGKEFKRDEFKESSGYKLAFEALLPRGYISPKPNEVPKDHFDYCKGCAEKVGKLLSDIKRLVAEGKASQDKLKWISDSIEKHLTLDIDYVI